MCRPARPGRPSKVVLLVWLALSTAASRCQRRRLGLSLTAQPDLTRAISRTQVNIPGVGRPSRPTKVSGRQQPGPQQVLSSNHQAKWSTDVKAKPKRKPKQSQTEAKTVLYSPGLRHLVEPCNRRSSLRQPLQSPSKIPRMLSQHAGVAKQSLRQEYQGTKPGACRWTFWELQSGTRYGHLWGFTRLAKQP